MTLEKMFQLERKCYWIGMPTVMLTENSKKKWVRVLGFLGMFPLFPLVFLGYFLIFTVMVVDMIQDI